jgi:hypothetical protein
VKPSERPVGCFFNSDVVDIDTGRRMPLLGVSPTTKLSWRGLFFYAGIGEASSATWQLSVIHLAPFGRGFRIERSRPEKQEDVST